MGLLKRKLMLLVVPLLILVVLGALFLLLAKPLFDLDLDLHLVERETTNVSVSILKEVRDIFAINTVEYVYKSVFPHDFVPSDYDWQGLLDKKQQGQALTGEELHYFSLYTLCRDIGIDLREESYTFVVVTSIITAGYDLGDTAYTTENDQSQLEEYIRISEDRTTIYIKPPEATIVDFVIEDSSSKEYGYPDIAVQPHEWKRISSFVGRKVQEKVIEENILETAGERGKQFLREILLDAGFQSVVFIEEGGT
jgi:hypothetical protein